MDTKPTNTQDTTAKVSFISIPIRPGYSTEAVSLVAQTVTFSAPVQLEDTQPIVTLDLGIVSDSTLTGCQNCLIYTSRCYCE